MRADYKVFDGDDFYAKLAAVRRAKAVTWKQVSKDTGVSQSTLSRMAEGRRPDAASLVALASWAGISLFNDGPIKPRGGLRPGPLTEDDVRRIVREELFPANLEQKTAALLRFAEWCISDKFDSRCIGEYAKNVIAFTRTQP